MSVNSLVKEDTVTRTRSSNPLGSYIDARDRAKMAMTLHTEFFNDHKHVDRVADVISIMRNFFGRGPDYITPRGINRKPFEAVKIQEVGHILSRTKAAVKNANLYAPLIALGDVEVISKNGHLTVRVF